MSRDNGKPFKFKEGRQKTVDPQIALQYLFEGEFEVFKEFVVSNPLCLNVKDTTNGNVPLHILSSRGDLVMMTFVINQGADVNIQDIFGNSAVHYATDKGKRTAVELLLQCGANANLQDHRGNAALHCACVNNDVETVRILLKYQADPELLDFDDMKPRDKTKSPMIRSLIDRRVHQINGGEEDAKKQTFQWMSLGVGLGK